MKQAVLFSIRVRWPLRGMPWAIALSLLVSLACVMITAGDGGGCFGIILVYSIIPPPDAAMGYPDDFMPTKLLVAAGLVAVLLSSAFARRDAFVRTCVAGISMVGLGWLMLVAISEGPTLTFITSVPFFSVEAAAIIMTLMWKDKPITRNEPRRAFPVIDPVQHRK